MDIFARRIINAVAVVLVAMTLSYTNVSAVPVHGTVVGDARKGNGLSTDLSVVKLIIIGEPSRTLSIRMFIIGGRGAH